MNLHVNPSTWSLRKEDHCYTLVQNPKNQADKADMIPFCKAGQRVLGGQRVRIRVPGAFEDFGFLV